VFLVMADCC